MRRGISPTGTTKRADPSKSELRTHNKVSTLSIKQYLENSRIDEEGYSHILVFYKFFYKRNRKRFSFRVSVQL